MQYADNSALSSKQCLIKIMKKQYVAKEEFPRPEPANTDTRDPHIL